MVQNAEDLANDPHLLDQDYFMKTQHPTLGKAVSDRSPIRFIQDSSTDPYPDVDLRAAPLLGEANEYVYMDLLGMTEQEYTSYIQTGIIA